MILYRRAAARSWAGLVRGLMVWRYCRLPFRRTWRCSCFTVSTACCWRAAAMPRRWLPADWGGFAAMFLMAAMRLHFLDFAAASALLEYFLPSLYRRVMRFIGFDAICRVVVATINTDGFCRRDLLAGYACLRSLPQFRYSTSRQRRPPHAGGRAKIASDYYSSLSRSRRKNGHSLAISSRRSLARSSLDVKWRLLSLPSFRCRRLIFFMLTRQMLYHAAGDEFRRYWLLPLAWVGVAHMPALTFKRRRLPARRREEADMI